MSRKKLAIVILVLLAGGLVAAARLVLFNDPKENALVLYGNVEIREVALAFRVPSRLEEIRFEEGDIVAADDVVARLDATPYEDALKAAQAEVAMRAAELARLEAGFRPAEVERARARVAELEAEVAITRKTYDRRKALVKDGAVSRQLYDEGLAAFRSADERLAAAREDLAIAVEGFRSEEIAAARAALQAAQAAAASAQTSVDDATLIAPSDGVILTRVRERGSILQAGEPVLTMALTRPVWVRAYVEEPALGLAAPGTPAEIITDAGGAYRGQIGFVSPVAEFTPKTVETPDLRSDLVYQVRIIVNEPDDGLRQGMPVTVRLAPPENRE